MSDELSFTESLRKNGLTKENQTTTSEETIEENVEEVKEAPKEVTNESSDETNIVYIGSKSIMSYVLTIVSMFNNKPDAVVTIKARGRVINKAVDVAEVLRHRFINDLNVKDIKTATEELQRNDGRLSNVSTIEITVSK